MPLAGRRARYLGFVAHELKNPLATALWSCDLLKRMEGEVRSGPKGEKMVDVSLRALRRMRRLVDDYFTIERLLEQGYELRKETVVVRDLLAESVSMLADKDGLATAGIQLDIPPQAQLVGDSDMLKRAMRAVLEHMCRPAPEPKVSVVAHPREQGGCNLLFRSEAPPTPLLPPPPEDRPSGDPAGAVLGFALAATILEAHGGSIIESEGGLLVSLPAA